MASTGDTGVHPMAVAGYKQGNLYDSKRPGFTDEAVDFIKQLLLSVEGSGNKVSWEGILTACSRLTHDLLQVHDEPLCHFCQDKPALNSQCFTHDLMEDIYDVVEVGSGTGKFTFRFLRRFDQPLKYLATEPLDSMLTVIKEKSSEVDTLQCTADKLPIPDSSAKMVVAAQCFHWFGNLESLTEIHRVLIPKGKLVLIWNKRDLSEPWTKELNKIFLEMDAKNSCPTEWKHVFEKFSGFRQLQQICLERSPIKGSLEEIISYFSTRTSLSVSEEDMARVSNFMRNHPDLQGLTEITVPLYTTIYWCEKLS